MTSKELNEIFNKTRRTPNISLTPEQAEELVKDLEILEILKKTLNNSFLCLIKSEEEQEKVKNWLERKE